jgi:hypothetical protein
VARKVAFRDLLPLLTGWQTTGVDVQHLPLALIVVTIARAVSAKDFLIHMPHFLDVFCDAVIQSGTHLRLVGTSGSAKGALQGTIGADSGIDLTQSLSSSQDVHERIQQFLHRAVLHSLLLDMDTSFDDSPDAHLAHQQPHCGQAAPRRKCGILAHGDSLPVLDIVGNLILSQVAIAFYYIVTPMPGIPICTKTRSEVLPPRENATTLL